MGALPISTLQLPSTPVTASLDAVADPGALPAGPEGDFHAVLCRNLAGQAARAMGPASAAAMLAAEDGKIALSAELSPNLAYAADSRDHAAAATLPVAEDSSAALLALLSSGITGDGGASTLPAAGDGSTDVPLVLSPDLTGLAAGAGNPAGAAEDGTASDEAAQDAAAIDTRAASENALALLAALPQPVARPETAAASPAATGRNLEGIGGERTPDAGSRTAEAAVTGPKFARAGEGEHDPTLRLDPDKVAERAVHGAEALPDASPAAASHGTHGALAAGLAPVAGLGVDPAAAGPAAAPGSAAPRIDTPLGAPGWSTALADRLLMIAGDKQQTAELHINPPQLGPVDITLTLSDDKASVVFASPHAVVRETIESALPRLREVLAESGINLGQASVTADSPRDGSAQAQAQARSSFGSGDGRAQAENTPLGASALAAARRARGLVDLFA